VKSLSRFARNTIDALTIIKETRKIGVEFYFEKENISSLDPAIDMIFTMMVSMAEQESASMSQNISWNFQKQAQKGKVLIQKCVGYTLTKDKRFTINPDEAPIIKKIFEMKLGDKSNTDIFEYVRSVGLKTVLGNEFVQNSQIIGILKDIKYTGQVVWGKTYHGKNNNEKVTFINNGERPKYIIKNHHEPIIDMDTYNRVQELIGIRKNDYPTTKNTTGWAYRFVYSLIDEKYLHVKQKVKDNPKYDLIENEKARKPGSPRIYSRNATHVLRKATIALARNFSDLEAKFDKQVKEHLDTTQLDKQMSKIAEKIRTYKKEYFMLKQKPELDEAEQSLMFELEESIIKLSVQYIKIEDEIIPFKDKLRRINDIKKVISSIELPMKELPIDTIKDIFDAMVVVDPENYVLIINASGKKLDRETLKKGTEIKPLLGSSCKANNKIIDKIWWNVIII